MLERISDNMVLDKMQLLFQAFVRIHLKRKIKYIVH